MYQIYHNPRCKTSRAVLNELLKNNPDSEIIEYLKSIPSAADLKKLLAKLNLKPQDIIRRKEKIFKEKFRGKKFTDDEWINIMREYPMLIERPIVVKNNKAIICRPHERIEEII
ncbi:MAG: arsenate reductase (glutaredoxin) [Bacteroidota bacterium]